jgi:NADH-quinone oxidoreductase subunit N
VSVFAATPVIIISAASILALMAGLFGPRAMKRDGPAAVGLLGILAALIMSAVLWGDRVEALGGGYRADRFSMLLNLIILTAAAVTLLLSWRESAGVDRRGEYTGLILVAAAGMMLVVGAGDLITLFLGIEILSVALYVLCALEVWRERSLESGLKYLIVGAVGSSILLYGLTFLFGSVGSTRLDVIGNALAEPGKSTEPFVLVAMALIAAGLAFKSSAAPFHMWTPDVYEGAPTPITAFMATATKAVAIAAFLRIFGSALIGLVDDWQIPIAAVAVASIVIGNLAALVQTSMKRMLAYSSVAQAGYLLIGVAAGTLNGSRAVLYYLLAYTVMTLAAFAIVIIREREVENGESIAALSGYGRTRPVLGMVLTVAVLSLAGFPPLSGFIGKFLLFGAAVDADLTWLAVVGAVGSMVSLGYYLRVLSTLWTGDSPDPARDKNLAVPGPVGIAALSCGIAVVAISLATSPFLQMCQGAAEALLAP